MNGQAKTAYFEKDIELTDGEMVSAYDLETRIAQFAIDEARALRETVASMKADVYDLADKWVVK